MKFKYQKTLKYSNDLVVGDQIKVGGTLCEIMKREDVHHYAPNNRIRLELKVVGATKKRADVILCLPLLMPITTVR